FREDYGLETRIVRYHNVYGPNGSYYGGRQKAPAALCRQVVVPKLWGHRCIEILGDGAQSRSVVYVGDCLYGTRGSKARATGVPRMPRSVPSPGRSTAFISATKTRFHSDIDAVTTSAGM